MFLMSITSISLTVRDRAILAKFLTHKGILSEYLTGLFTIPKKIFGSHFEFLKFFLTKNAKSQNGLYLHNGARYSDFVEIFDPEGI